MTRAFTSLLVGLMFPLVACGGSSPSAPSGGQQPPQASPPTTPAMLTLSGRVTATNGGRPLGGVRVDAAGSTSTTDDSGG